MISAFKTVKGKEDRVIQIESASDIAIVSDLNSTGTFNMPVSKKENSVVAGERKMLTSHNSRQEDVRFATRETTNESGPSDYYMNLHRTMESSSNMGAKKSLSSMQATRSRMSKLAREKAISVRGQKQI